MARRSQEDRNRAAQGKLLAMGRDPGPLKGAEYRHRVATAEQRGLSPGQAVGKPRQGEKSKTELRREGQLPPLRTRDPRRVDLGPRGVIHTSNDRAYVMRQLRQAARDRESVEIRITARGIKDGTEVTQTRILDGRQPAAVEHMFAVIDSNPPKRSLRSESDSELVRKPSFTIGSTGIPAQTLIDYLDAYDDWEDALIDLWDEFASS